MAVSEQVRLRLIEAMDSFKEVFNASKFEVRIRSPKRKGGDREFLLNMNGKNLAGVHVKRNAFKMYMSDELVDVSDNKSKYERLNGGQFIIFNSIDECINEIKSALNKLGVRL